MSYCAYTRAYYASRSLEFRGWRTEHAEACADAVKAARQADDRTLLSLYLMLHAYYQYHQSAYRAAYCTAEEGRQLAAGGGRCVPPCVLQSFQTVALLHLGAWGEMRGLLRDAYQRAEKNGHQLEMIFFQLEIAWLHEQAFDFKRTRALCEQALEQARETGHDKTTPLFLGLILAGFAHLGLKHYEQAFDCFSEIPGRIEREGLVMDWIMQLPLHHGLSQYWLAQGAFERARQEAERLCALAAQSGERTYLALGRRTLAEIALTEQHWDQAEEELKRALAVLGEAEAPLAAWRGMRSRRSFMGSRGGRRELGVTGPTAQRSLIQIANSLDSGDPLRDSFLSAPPVRAVLGHTQGVRGKG